MGRQSVTLIVGISIGVTIGVVLATFTLLCIRLRRRRSQVHRSSNDQRGVSLPIRINGVDSSQIMSDAIVHESSQASKQNGRSSWWGLHEKNFVPSASGIPKYSYKDLQKATHNFTTVLGKGAFGPVYKATMPTGEIVAVKVLATDSKQGEREFQNEVSITNMEILHSRVMNY